VHPGSTATACGAIIGGAAGGVAGHLWRGMSRGDLKELGEALDEGQAAVILVGESKIEDQIERATKRARDDREADRR